MTHCSVCHRYITLDEELVPLDNGWAHRWCADSVKADRDDQTSLDRLIGGTD